MWVSMFWVKGTVAMQADYDARCPVCDLPDFEGQAYEDTMT